MSAIALAAGMREVEQTDGGTGVGEGVGSTDGVRVALAPIVGVAV
jgi:hypothetical protein